MRFAFINNGGGLVSHRGKWSSKAPCIESWAHLLDADFFSGTQGNQQTWESLNQYDIIMINQNNTMFELTWKIKENCPHPFIIATAEGSVCNIGRFSNEALCHMVKAARACDMYGVLVDWSVPYYQSITSKPVQWIGIPFYLEFFAPYKIDAAQKNSLKPVIGLQNALGDGRNGTISVLIASRIKDATLLLPHLQPGWVELSNALGIENIEFSPYLGWEDYMKRYSRTYFCIHLDTLYTYGRFPLDMAALGIPVIGSNRNHTNKILWPGLTIDPIKETKRAGPMIDQLLNDKDFYDAQVRYAQSVLPGFAPEITKKRLLNIIHKLTKGRLSI